MLAARTLGRVLALSRGAGQLVHGRAAAAAAAAGATSDAVGARRAAESLSTAELFRLLDACKVDYRDALEKKELVERLLAARAGLPTAAAALVERVLASAAAPSPAALRRSSSQGARHGLSVPLQPEEAGVVATFARAAPSVAFITAVGVAQGGALVPRGGAEASPRGTGSGFLWDAQGHVVTNYHVIQHATRVAVSVGEGKDAKTFEAGLVGVDRDKDLAVLKLRDVPQDYALQPLDVGTSSSLLVGQTAMAIGNPFGLDRSLSVGVVSAVGREVRSVSGRTIAGVIQTDAAINPGNSGGPLLDSRGALIGVNTMILSPSGAFAGVGFAVPVDTVRRSVNQILRHGRVARAGLGVSVFHGSEGAMGLPGVLVMVVPPQSEAQRAGLRGTVQDARTGQTILGDVITEVDGTAVRGTEDLLNLLESKVVGQTVELTVQRGTMLAATRRVRLRLQDVGPTD